MMFDWLEAQTFDLSLRLKGYEEMRILLFALQIALHRMAHGTNAEHVAIAAISLLKDVFDGMPINTAEELERLAKLDFITLMEEGRKVNAARQ